MINQYFTIVVAASSVWKKICLLTLYSKDEYMLNWEWVGGVKGKLTFPF